MLGAMWYGMKPATKQKVANKLVAVMSRTATTKDMSLKGRIKHDANNDISYSVTKYATGRSNKKSRYDSVNCARGYITDSLGGEFIVDVGKQGFYKMPSWSDELFIGTGVAYTRPSEWWGFLPSNGYVTVSGTKYPVTRQPMLQFVQGKRPWIECQYQEMETEYVNNNLHPVTLILWDLQAKEDLDDDGSPITLINRGILEQGAGNQSLFSSPYFEVGTKENLAFDLMSPCAKLLWKYWHLSNVVQVYLKPGERHVHTTVHRKNWTVNPEITNSDLVNVAPTFYKFQTTETIVQTIGHVVKVKASAPQDQGLVTIDGSKLIWFTKVKTQLRQTLEKAEFYHLDNTVQHTGVNQFQSGVPGYYGTPIPTGETEIVVEDDPTVK